MTYLVDNRIVPSMSSTERHVTPTSKRICTLSPNRERHDFELKMSAVAQAIRNKKEGVLIQWQSTNNCGQQIETLIENLPNAPEPFLKLILLKYELDRGYQRGEIKLTLPEIIPVDQLELQRLVTRADFENTGLYVGNELQIVEFFAVACRALETWIDPSQIKNAAASAVANTPQKFINIGSFGWGQEVRIRFAHELSARQFL